LIALESSNAAFDPNYFRDPRNPRAVNSVYGYQWAVLPPAPLASLAIGQSDLLPYYSAVTASSRHTSVQLDELQNPLQLLAGRFDLAFVAVYLLPLLVFALSYNMLSEERENGTLSLVLAQPATLRTLLLAKSLLRVAYVALISIALSAAGFLTAGVHLGEEGMTSAAVAWTLTVMAYGLVWLGIATLVNSRGWSSSTNAVTLAAIWLFLVAIVPSVLNVVIATVHPLPSRIALVEAAREAQSRALTRIGQRPSISGPIDMDERARSSLIQIMEAEAEVLPVLRRFDEQLDKQQQQVQRWRWVSPAIMAQLALTQIAATDGARYREFVNATERFRARWREFLYPIYPRQFTAADIDRIPKFSFTEPAYSQHSQATAFVLFGAYAIGMSAALRFARRDAS
jgi:ABC-2 type transport system permease protein